MKMNIAVSMGDYNGIGPEVILKCLRQESMPAVTPVILGNSAVFEYYLALFDLSLPMHHVTSPSDIRDGAVNIWNTSSDDEIQVEPGNPSKSSGMAAMKAVEKGIELCMAGAADALVTAPISKEAVQQAGYNIPGHTEFLAQKTGCTHYMMILASGKLRVGLVTGHIPLADVSPSLRTEQIRQKIDTLYQSLQNDFGISTPRIAVLGLNPHAGEGGVLGNEETDIIKPAIEKALEKGIVAEGPFPADGFFGNRFQDSFDGILAMYHDQGLVPFKTLSFGTGVNFTAGLPVIRTSPDHGTAFEIAGKNRASEKSFTSAYYLAIEMAEKRRPVKKE